MKEIKLSNPNYKSFISLEEAIYNRTSYRSFIRKQLIKDQLSQLLWSVQGLIKDNKRAVPSAGALYPLEIFAVIGDNGVEDIDCGVYRYINSKNSLYLHRQGDLRKPLGSACLGQDFIAEAPVIIIITADFKRTTIRYGERGCQYVYMEAGHAGQNIYLESGVLGLGTVAIGAFSDGEAAKALRLPDDLIPLYIFPVGYAR